MCITYFIMEYFFSGDHILNIIQVKYEFYNQLPETQKIQVICHLLLRVPVTSTPGCVLFPFCAYLCRNAFN